MNLELLKKIPIKGAASRTEARSYKNKESVKRCKSFIRIE